MAEESGATTRNFAHTRIKLGDIALNTTRLKTIITTAVVFTVMGLTACQSSTGLKKDPEKAVQVRSQLAAEYIRQPVECELALPFRGLSLIL